MHGALSTRGFFLIYYLFEGAQTPRSPNFNTIGLMAYIIPVVIWPCSYCCSVHQSSTTERSPRSPARSWHDTSSDTFGTPTPSELNESRWAQNDCKDQTAQCIRATSRLSRHSVAHQLGTTVHVGNDYHDSDYPMVFGLHLLLGVVRVCLPRCVYDC